MTMVTKRPAVAAGVFGPKQARDWVRLAQRVPVRDAIDHVPDDSRGVWKRESAAGLAVRETTALRSAIRLLDEAGRALPIGQDEARRLLVQAAALLQAESDSRDQVAEEVTAVAGCRLAPWQVKRVTRFIDANLGTKVRWLELANLARLSPSYFARAFRQTVGKTPHSYLVHRRIERAKELMLETDQPIARIALDCGLSDQAHLTRLFTRLVGLSPAAWRRVYVPGPTRRRKMKDHAAFQAGVRASVERCSVAR